MAEERRLLVAAGGTGGHLFPAIAVVREAERLGPVRVCFVGRADRLEGRIVPALGYEFVPLPMVPFAGWRLRSAGFPLAFLRSMERLVRLVRRFRPHVVLTTGAYLGVPAGLLARWARIPLVVLEVNLLPGKAIRLLARWADVVVTGYPETAGYLPERARARVRCLGVPVRPEFCAVPESGEARRLLGLDAEQPVVAVLGGSLGAQRLNSVAERLLPAVARGAFQLVWQYGERFAVPSELPPGVVARPFYDEPALVLAAADCVVSRAGGMTIAELCCVGRASVLVPYPAATEQHQLANARWMEQWGAAICITDDRAEAEVPHIVERLVHDGEYRQRMAAAARRLAHPDAARRIAELVWQL